MTVRSLLTRIEAALVRGFCRFKISSVKSRFIKFSSPGARRRVAAPQKIKINQVGDAMRSRGLIFRRDRIAWKNQVFQDLARGEISLTLTREIHVVYVYLRVRRQDCVCERCPGLKNLKNLIYLEFQPLQNPQT